MATTLPGVRPSMSLASRPTATTSPLFLLMATMEGSLTTIPLPPENTSVFAVPKSIARSDENKLNTDLRLYPFLFIPQSPRRRVFLHRRAGRDSYNAWCATVVAQGKNLRSPAFFSRATTRSLACHSVILNLPDKSLNVKQKQNQLRV